MPELTEIKGVGPVLAKACADNGYTDVEQIAAAMLHDLVAVPGISEAKAKLVIAAAQDLLNDNQATVSTAGSAGSAPDDAKGKKKTKKKKGKKKDRKTSKKEKKKKKKKAKKNGKKS